MAQWIRLAVPSCGPVFESQAQHLCFFNLFVNCGLERTKINKKEARNGTNLQKNTASFEVNLKAIRPAKAFVLE